MEKEQQPNTAKKVEKTYTEKDMLLCYTAAVINTTRTLILNQNVTISAEDYLKSLEK